MTAPSLAPLAPRLRVGYRRRRNARLGSLSAQGSTMLEVRLRACGSSVRHRRGGVRVEADPARPPRCRRDHGAALIDGATVNS